MKKSLKDFLKTAILPVGKTLYVWGGGWNKEDNKAGKGSKCIGPSPRWEIFYRKNQKKYDYKHHKYKINDGLDCSGYVGWVVYNVIGKECANDGFVFKSNDISRKYAELGLGTYTKKKEVIDHKPSDIMSGNDHVYIVIGECQDRSLVILHSSPNGGVKINGTVNEKNSKNSEAIKIASQYMKNYYPKWSETFGEFSKGIEYLTNFDQFRWNEAILPDRDQISKKAPSEILKILHQNIT